MRRNAPPPGQSCHEAGPSWGPCLWERRDVLLHGVIGPFGQWPLTWLSLGTRTAGRMLASPAIKQAKPWGSAACWLNHLEGEEVRLGWAKWGADLLGERVGPQQMCLCGAPGWAMCSLPWPHRSPIDAAPTRPSCSQLTARCCCPGTQGTPGLALWVTCSAQARPGLEGWHGVCRVAWCSQMAWPPGARAIASHSHPVPPSSTADIGLGGQTELAMLCSPTGLWPDLQLPHSSAG